METFSASLAICAGNAPVTGEFPAQRPVARGFDVFFDLRLNKPLSKHREAVDLRRHCTHYDVIVMLRLKLQGAVDIHNLKRKTHGPHEWRINNLLQYFTKSAALSATTITKYVKNVNKSK